MSIRTLFIFIRFKNSISVKISIDDEEYYKLGDKTVTEGQDVKVKLSTIEVEILKETRFHENRLLNQKDIPCCKSA